MMRRQYMDGFYHRQMRQPSEMDLIDAARLMRHALYCRPEDVTTANEYRDMYFRYLMAKRDYPWATHRPPSLKSIFFFEPARVAEECEREFYR